jgi:hypothetical protein
VKKFWKGEKWRRGGCFQKKWSGSVLALGKGECEGGAKKGAEKGVEKDRAS